MHYPVLQSMPCPGLCLSNWKPTINQDFDQGRYSSIPTKNVYAAKVSFQANSLLYQKYCLFVFYAGNNTIDNSITLLTSNKILTSLCRESTIFFMCAYVICKIGERRLLQYFISRASCTADRKETETDLASCIQLK